MNNNIKESPILFSGPMVKAIQEGRKTQTRRVVRHNPPSHCNVKMVGNLARFTASSFAAGYHGNGTTYDREITCPYGQLGDWLWVRETWYHNDYDGIPLTLYRADWNSNEQTAVKWQPSIFMPRWVCRLTLEVIGVRVEQLQDISGEDAKAEGIERVNDAPHWAYRDYTGNGQKLSPCMSYQSLWDSINGKLPGCSWDDNPWVWVVEFKRVETAGAARLPGM